MSKVTHKYDSQAMHAILKSPYGGLAKDMIKRAIRVRDRARENLLSSPRRYHDGNLWRSIGVQFFTVGGYPATRIGSDLEYARFVHDGTGIYGPKGVPIKPKKSKYLVFTPYGAVRPVFTKEVKGMPPNPFLKNALMAARY